MADKKLTLRCQFSDGRKQVLNQLTCSSTVCDLKLAVYSLTNIAPEIQRIKCGFPPKEIDLTSEDKKLKDTCIRSGDTLIIEELKTNKYSTSPILASSSKLVRKVVPADNSCLFASLSLVMLSDTSFASELRQLAATCIAQDPVTYNETFLGRPNADYCNWLTAADHWGGAIELNVFSRHYGMEINVADIQSCRIDRYGEDQNYTNRVFLLYDGIHYDAIVAEAGGEFVQSVFPVNDTSKQFEAIAIAEECKKLRQFTDLAQFSLRCLICYTPLKGQMQAQQHAKETGHMNFGEV